MRIAFQSAGGYCVYSNEWNSFSQQTYAANFGEIPEGDITKVDANDIPEHDILVAGFPCQPFLMKSTANTPCQTISGTIYKDMRPSIKRQGMVLVTV